MKYGWRRGNTTYFEDRFFEKLLFLTIASSRILLRLKTHIYFFFIWNGAHRCLVNTVLSLLRHTQCEHDFRRFSIIRFIHKTPFEIINSFQNHTKKTIPKTHQTSVSVAPNALEPLNYLASHCSFGCSAPKTVFFLKKNNKIDGEL